MKVIKAYIAVAQAILRSDACNPVEALARSTVVDSNAELSAAWARVELNPHAQAILMGQLYIALACVAILTWLGDGTGIALHSPVIDAAIQEMDISRLRAFRNAVFHPSYNDPRLDQVLVDGGEVLRQALDVVELIRNEVRTTIVDQIIREYNDE